MNTLTDRNATECAIDAETGTHTSIAAAWSHDGFVVLRSLVRASLIDNLVSEFKADILPSKRPLLRQPRFAQESGPRAFPHAYLAQHELTPGGHMRQGLKDVHALSEHPSVAGLALRIICGPEIQSALAACDPRYEAYTMYQSMLFDANPGTEPHQDCFYIDSEPRGALVGLWLALEDIDPRAGRFFVVRGSHRDVQVPGAEAMRNTDYLQAIAARMPGWTDAVVTPALRKGDAILWHGNLVHGAHLVADSRYSRKSITAHYVPHSLVGRGNARILSNRVIRIATKMSYVVTHKPEPADRSVASSEINTVQIDGTSVRFLCIETADGERTVFTANSMPAISG